jgi:YHS domain-containing protein
VLLAAHQAPLDLPLGSQVEKQVLPQPQAEPTHVAQGPWRQSDPPLALGGYCPVMLGKNEQWVKGDARCSVVHQGQTYRFAGQVQRECFLVDPDRYVPACAGDDPVLLKDENRRVPGQLEYCMTYDGRLYLFSAATTLARFQDEPKRYAAAPQH